LRSLQEVARDLLQTGATLFKDPREREEVEKAIEEIGNRRVRSEERKAKEWP
jgi:hypothetical protein